MAYLERETFSVDLIRLLSFMYLLFFLGLKAIANLFPPFPQNTWEQEAIFPFLNSGEELRNLLLRSALDIVFWYS
jgi:hypothetical protein